MREYVKLSVKQLKCDENLATSSLSKQVAQLVTPISEGLNGGGVHLSVVG